MAAVGGVLLASFLRLRLAAPGAAGAVQLRQVTPQAQAAVGAMLFYTEPGFFRLRAALWGQTERRPLIRAVRSIFTALAQAAAVRQFQALLARAATEACMAAVAVAAAHLSTATTLALAVTALTAALSSSPISEG